MNPTLVHAGLDIAKATLDLHLHLQGRAWRFPHDPPGCAALLARLQTAGAPVRVICEATGGWERPVVAALHAAGPALSVVNPRLVRDFARRGGGGDKRGLVDGRARHAPRPSAGAGHAHRTRQRARSVSATQVELQPVAAKLDELSGALARLGRPTEPRLDGVNVINSLLPRF